MQEVLRLVGPESLPSWVAFPDTDRAEWLNVILRKVPPCPGSTFRFLLASFFFHFNLTMSIPGVAPPRRPGAPADPPGGADYQGPHAPLLAQGMLCLKR